MLSFGGGTVSCNPLQSFPQTLKRQPFPNPNLCFSNRIHVRFSRFCSSSSPPPAAAAAAAAPVVTKRKRYRKLYPGESAGIVEEMRFVAMRLRNDGVGGGDEGEAGEPYAVGGENTWNPTVEGFLKYLVDSKLVFDTIEHIVDKSDDVVYVYFRNTGLERSNSLSKDLEWFRQQGFMIPEPNSPGTTYAAYLNEMAEKSAPLFLSHFYNTYFAHITGGQGIGKQVCEKLFQGRVLEFYKWEKDAPELLNDVREKLNQLGEHWTRDEKNRCLTEAAKSFRFLGQIIRLIIL